MDSKPARCNCSEEEFDSDSVVHAVHWAAEHSLRHGPSQDSPFHGGEPHLFHIDSPQSVPQCSALGPFLIFLYTLSLNEDISSPGLSNHRYADDTQVILLFLPSHTDVSAWISECLTDMWSCMAANQLKLNPSKTELLYISGDSSLPRSRSEDLPGQHSVPHLILSLMIVLDNQLSFLPHLAKMNQSCKFLLYNIRTVHHFLYTEASQVLIQSIVIWRLN